MLKKFIKRFAVALSCLGLVATSSFSSSTVFAAEQPEGVRSEVTETTGENFGISLYGYNSDSIVLKHNSAQSVKLVNMGFNPTVTVTATGNPNMLYKVWVVNPVGVTGTVGYVTANGSSITKNLWMSVGGDYFVYVQPWEGSTNGKDVTFNLSITW